MHTFAARQSNNRVTLEGLTGIIRETASDNFRFVAGPSPLVEQPWAEVQTELDSLKRIFDCLAQTVIFSEDELTTSVLYLVKGQVKLSMNSSSGRRLILGIANPGETLGLAASLCGNRFDTTAETLSRCKLASIARDIYLDFLGRPPAAYKNVARELCLDRTRAHEQLRTLGLAATAPARLARLLLEWCDDGQKTNQGTRLSCWFTHGEIGEFIGSSRETVTRIFSDFKCRNLLKSGGSTLIISNVKALELYAGIEKFN
jgi:CRP/FNR family cyclic AMP-dependent transcriptional regulator